MLEAAESCRSSVEAAVKLCGPGERSAWRWLEARPAGSADASVGGRVSRLRKTYVFWPQEESKRCQKLARRGSDAANQL